MRAIDVPIGLWVAFVALVTPWNAIVAGRQIRAGTATPANAPNPRVARYRTMSRRQLYRGSALGLGAVLIVSLLMDWAGGAPVTTMALTFPPHGVWWVIGCLAVHQAVSIGTMLVRRARGMPLDPGILRVLPRTAGDMVAFAGLSLLAGMAEEFFYRGFAPYHIARWGLPLWVAMAIVAVSFGLAHGYKSLFGMVRSAAIGMVVAVPVLVTGTLLPSIVAHALMDLVAGATSLPMARVLGVPEQAPAAPAPVVPEVPPVV